MTIGLWVYLVIQGLVCIGVGAFCYQGYRLHVELHEALSRTLHQEDE